MNDNLGLNWMAPVSAYNVVVPDLAALAKEYAKFVYKICAGEDQTLEAACCECRCYPTLQC